MLKDTHVGGQGSRRRCCDVVPGEWAAAMPLQANVARRRIGTPSLPLRPQVSFVEVSARFLPHRLSLADKFSAADGEGVESTYRWISPDQTPEASEGSHSTMRNTFSAFLRWPSVSYCMTCVEESHARYTTRDAGMVGYAVDGVTYARCIWSVKLRAGGDLRACYDQAKERKWCLNCSWKVTH